MLCAVTDLPDPDSPTTQTISPGTTVKDTSSTAFIRSARGGSRMVRFSSVSTGAAVIATLSPGSVILRWSPKAALEGSTARDRAVALRGSLRSHLRVTDHGSHPSREFWIQPIAQAVAQHVHGEHSEREADAGVKDVMREDAKEAAAFRHDVAPGRGLRRNADAEEGKDSLDQDRVGADESAL